jgi:hypothetical protein
LRVRIHTHRAELVDPEYSSVQSDSILNIEWIMMIFQEYQNRNDNQ